MLDIKKNIDGSTAYFLVEGWLDASTAPELEQAVKGSLKDIKELILDFVGLEYISSAGLRVLLSLQKIMNAQGKMVIRNVKQDVKNILEITGFLDILTLE